MSFMDKSLEDGGATWNMTIYQIVYESSSNALFLKRKIEDKEWQYIDLDSMFKGILLIVYKYMTYKCNER